MVPTPRSGSKRPFGHHGGGRSGGRPVLDGRLGPARYSNRRVADPAMVATLKAPEWSSSSAEAAGGTGFTGVGG